MRYVVLVPVKPPSVGKSRLVGLADEARRDLAEAFALDTVAACLAADLVAQVLVATDDAAFAARVSALGAAAIPDATAGDLNATLRATAAEAARRWPDLGPVALTADLPALTSADLDDALGRLAPLPAIVADTEGIGTTLYAAAHGSFAPAYGEGSRAAHVAAGAHEVDGTLATLRRDVDDLGDLLAALALGAGPRTANAAAALGLG